MARALVSVAQDRQPKRRRVNSLVAAAAILDATTPKVAVQSMEWQREAWAYYESCGELQFGVSWLSNALSRVRLVPARKVESGQEPVPIEEDDPNFKLCWEVRDQLAGGVTGQSQMMADFGVHLSVPGVCYLVGEEQAATPGTVPQTEWVVYSSDELRKTTASGAITDTASQYDVLEAMDKWRPLAPDTLVVKLWRPNRRFHWLADSPVRACLPVLRELAILSQYIDATATSRLAGAGILFVPSEAQFPTVEGQDEAADSFTTTLVESMTTPITQPDSAARVVPLVVRVPADMIQHFSHMTFGSPFDSAAQALRKEAIDRFAAGMDVPKEIITGTGDVNHWGAWQLSDSGNRLHVFPMAEIVSHALTLGYYQPALASQGVVDDSYCLWYDASELEVVADKPKNAQLLYDRQLISGQVLRDVTGFDEADQMSEQEFRDTLIINVLDKLPALAGLLLPALGITDSGLPEQPLVIPRETISEAVPPGKGPGETEGGDSTSDPNQPGTTPDTDEAGPPQDSLPASAAEDDALMASCDGLVYRAMEKAGNRIRSQLPKSVASQIDCPPWNIHTCVEDVSSLGVLDRFLQDGLDRVDDVAARYSVDAPSLRKRLHAYCRSLIATGEPHDFHRMVEFLGGDA